MKEAYSDRAQDECVLEPYGDSARQVVADALGRAEVTFHKASREADHAEHKARDLREASKQWGYVVSVLTSMRRRLESEEGVT